MLVSTVVGLRTCDESAWPAHSGRAAYALFLRLVAAADPAMAVELHKNSDVKPFTVSDLIGLPNRKVKGCPLASGLNCYLRLTTYEDSLSKLLVSKVLPSFPDRVELGNIRFLVEIVSYQNSVHPLCGQSTYEELANRFLFSTPQISQRIKLIFSSPTTFRSRGKNVPLPLPELVFGSLADRWNAFSPVTIPTALRQFADDCIAVSQCLIRTRSVTIAGSKQVGFEGVCTYVILNNDSYWARLIHLLTAFAFYSSVGYKTTVGLGQAHSPSHLPDYMLHHIDGT